MLIIPIFKDVKKPIRTKIDSTKALGVVGAILIAFSHNLFHTDYYFAQVY